MAWIGDGAAEAALTAMAKDPGNPFRVRAVETLANLPLTPAINMTLRDLVATPDALVRIEAYKGLVRNEGSAVFSKKIGD
ncbi:MAG: HEAT repeat domain-containing protein, partial [Oxalobacteraceae bacterium]